MYINIMPVEEVVVLEGARQRVAEGVEGELRMVYMYVCMYIYIYIYTRMYIYIYTHTSIHICVHTNV